MFTPHGCITVGEHASGQNREEDDGGCHDGRPAIGRQMSQRCIHLR